MNLDITYCNDVECPLAKYCVRRDIPSSPYNSYFDESPASKKGGEFHCEMFMGDQSRQMINNLFNEE